MDTMAVTAPVFQSPIFWSKTDAPSNLRCYVSKRQVVSSVASQRKTRSTTKPNKTGHRSGRVTYIYSILGILEVSQPEMSVLKLVLGKRASKDMDKKHQSLIGPYVSSAVGMSANAMSTASRSGKHGVHCWQNSTGLTPRLTWNGHAEFKKIEPRLTFASTSPLVTQSHKPVPVNALASLNLTNYKKEKTY